MGAKKQIKRKEFRGGAYHSAFPNPRRATEKSLLSFLKKYGYNLEKIFHSPPLCQVIYRFFRAKMSGKISFRTFLRLAKDIINFPVENLKTADAVFCFLTVTNCLAHQSEFFNSKFRFALRKKKSEAILHLISTMPDCYILEKDLLGKGDNYRWVLKRRINDIDSFHISDELAEGIRARKLST